MTMTAPDGGDLRPRSNVMLGYLNQPEATAEAMKGWFHTGDLGCCDEDGYFSIVDRKKDMVLVGAEPVPREVEESS